jgi:chemotaxis protein histidine kinase CheA
MKARRPGAIVGKTLAGFDPENNIGFCDAELKQQLSDMGLQVEGDDCFGRVLVVLDADFDMGIGEVVQDALDNITNFATAMDELMNTAFEKGAEFTKLVVGQFVAKIAIVEKLFVKETHTQTLCIADSSGAETCVTKAQLDALLANVGVAAAPQPEPEPQSEDNATSTPPTEPEDGNASSTPPVSEGESSPPAEEPEEEAPPAEEPESPAEVPSEEEAPPVEPIAQASEPEPTPESQPESTPTPVDSGGENN